MMVSSRLCRRNFRAYHLTSRTGAISSLKNVKKDVTEMRKGTECGVGFESWLGFVVGDHIQCYEEIYENRYL